MKKMTKKEMFTRILTQLTNAEDIAFVEHEIELLEKRKTSKSPRVTARQKANEVIKAAIVDAMKEDTLYSISDLFEHCAAIEGFSSQKVSALLKQLVEAGLVDKTYENRKPLFMKAS